MNQDSPTAYTTQDNKTYGHCKIPFGAVVKDKISGMQGKLTARFYLISGCCQLSLQTDERHGETKRPVYLHISEQLSEVLDTSAMAGIPQCEDVSGFVLGEKVHVPHLGLEGTVTGICFYPAQATHLEVMPVYNVREGKQPDSVSVAEQLVKPIGRADAPVKQKHPSPAHVDRPELPRREF